MNKTITMNLICAKCNKEFSVTREKNRLQGKNIPKHCSRKCANSRIHSIETISKITNSICNYIREVKHIEPIVKSLVNKAPKIRKLKEVKYCLNCGTICKNKYCSWSCSASHLKKSNREILINKLKNGENIITTNYY